MIQKLRHHLPNRDLTELISLSHRSLSCNSQAELCSLVADLGRLFLFENAVCARGNVLDLIQAADQEPQIDICNVSYPDEYLDLYMQKQYYYSDAVFCEFITNLDPVNWQRIDKKYNFDYPASVMAQEFSMHDGWTHGVLDPQSMDSIVFFLGGPLAENNIRTASILRYITPFYAEAYKRVLNRAKPGRRTLTAKEIEILDWIKEGKSSWETSMILKCSKRTIDFHVNNIKQKLNAVTRAQAVAKGLHWGIIAF